MPSGESNNRHTPIIAAAATVRFMNSPFRTKELNLGDSIVRNNGGTEDTKTRRHNDSGGLKGTAVFGGNLIAKRRRSEPDDSSNHPLHRVRGCRRRIALHRGLVSGDRVRACRHMRPVGDYAAYFTPSADFRCSPSP